MTDKKTDLDNDDEEDLEDSEENDDEEDLEDSEENDDEEDLEDSEESEVNDDEEDSEDSKESEVNDDEEDSEDSKENDDEDNNYEGGYKIGYYRVLCTDDESEENNYSNDNITDEDDKESNKCSEKECNATDTLKVIKISESFLATPGEEFANTFFDEFDTSEEDLIDYEEMQEDEEFKQVFIINQDLENNLISFERSINPYSAILCCREVLEKYDLILPDFNLDPSVDEWILDIELIDDSANIEVDDRDWFLHLEILKNDEQSYIIFAGVVPN